MNRLQIAITGLCCLLCFIAGSVSSNYFFKPAKSLKTEAVNNFSIGDEDFVCVNPKKVVILIFDLSTPNKSGYSGWHPVSPSKRIDMGARLSGRGIDWMSLPTAHLYERDPTNPAKIGRELAVFELEWWKWRRPQ